MIPRNLPRLAYDAIEKGWDAHVERDHYYRGLDAVLALFLRRETEVQIHWGQGDGYLIASTINGTLTPYADCVRLIRSAP